MPAIADEGVPPIVAALRRTEHCHDDDYCQRTYHTRKGEWEHRQQQMEQVSRHGWSLIRSGVSPGCRKLVFYGI